MPLVFLVWALLALVAPAAAASSAEWIWPVSGPVLVPFTVVASPFARGQHRGIDIGAPVGRRVRSACPGHVRFAGTAGPSGRTVSVACDDLSVTYLHLAAISVRRGQSLGRGALLGMVGRSGSPRIATPHLHLGVRRIASRWSYVDPLSLLPPPDGRAPTPAPLGPAPRAPANPLPAPALAPLRPAPVRPAVAPAWTPPTVAWGGLALLAMALPALGLRAARRRHSRSGGRVADVGRAP